MKRHLQERRFEHRRHFEHPHRHRRPRLLFPFCLRVTREGRCLVLWAVFIVLICGVAANARPASAEIHDRHVLACRAEMDAEAAAHPEQHNLYGSGSTCGTLTTECDGLLKWLHAIEAEDSTDDSAAYNRARYEYHETCE